jgi:hypothetical protein
LNRTQTGKKTSQAGKNRVKPEKPSQTGKTKKNRFEPVFVLKKPNRTETGRFKPVSVFFLNRFGYFLG